MDLDPQDLFNALLTLAGVLGGWVLKSLKDSIDDLRVQDRAIVQKVQNIEILVAGDYAKKTDMNKLGDAIFAKLDRIEGKLDAKADKQ